jgi:hypothetical protein
MSFATQPKLLNTFYVFLCKRFIAIDKNSRYVRKQILEGHSKNVFGKSFGQRENLKTRIQGILKGYPCDVAILKELVQNDGTSVR